MPLCKIPRDRREDGIAGVTVELLDDEGAVVATTETNGRGGYRFDQFSETGDYQVRVAASPEVGIASQLVGDLLISRGDQRLRGLDLGVSLLDQLAEDVANARTRRT